MDKMEDITLSEYYIQFVRDRITQLRLEKGVSERAMSHALGHGDSYIRQISSGKMSPQLASFFDICEYLGVTPVEFFDIGNENPEALNRLLRELKNFSSYDQERLSKFFAKISPESLRQLLDWIKLDED